MKTHLLTAILGIFLFSSAMAQYESGDIDFNLGGGISIFGVKNNDDADTSGRGGAINNMWNLSASYAIIPELSVGYCFERNGFVSVGNDDSTSSGNNDASAQSNNHKFDINYRMVNSEKNALSLQAMLGLSMFEFNDNSSNTLTGTGMMYEFGLTYQHLFGEHFGYYLNGSYSSYKYGELTDQDGIVWKTDDDSKNMILSLSGGALRLGVVYKM